MEQGRKIDMLGQRAVVDPTLDESLDAQAERAWSAYVKAVAVNELRRPPHLRLETLPWYVRLACWVWTRGWQRKPVRRPVR